MPTISVIVPIYNAEKYLEKCINSLIHQTYPYLQIILVNDGSTDTSEKIAQAFAKQDHRIIVQSQANKGQAAARNNGLQLASGEYISFIDADDYIDHDFYERMLNSIKDKDCVQIGYKRVTLDGKILHEQLPKRFKQFTSPCMRLYRKTLFDKNNLHFLEGYIYEDVIFSIDLWACDPTYTIIGYTGYNYLVNANSTTSTRNKIAEKKLYQVLRQKRKNAHNIRQKLTILYTTIRLKFHFMRYE